MIYHKLNKKITYDINHIDTNPIIEIDNTFSLSTNKLSKILNEKCQFIVWGGIKDINITPYYKRRITYTLKEMKEIILAFEKMESNMPSPKKEKAIFIYDYIRKNIVYDQKDIRDKEIRSLKIIVNKYGVCSGFALLLKECLERQKIKCKYIKHKNHAWNIVYIDRKKYEFDITWDVTIYQKVKSSNLHYFANNHFSTKKHFNLFNIKNSFSNTLLNYFQLHEFIFNRYNGTNYSLTLLPIGIDRKYYIYKEKNYKCIVSTYEDMEAIYGEEKQKLIEYYINYFFSESSIRENNIDNLSFIGYGYIEKNCFYKKRDFVEDKYIKTIDISNNIFYIDTIEKKYKIDDKNIMEEIC